MSAYVEKYNLDADVPEKVPKALRYAADRYRESHTELVSAWQDNSAGRVWSKIAAVLDRAAASIEKILQKEGY